MLHRVKLLVWLSSALLLHAIVRAAVAEAASDPYQSIPARNVFGLQPTEVRLSEARQAPLPKIILVGITTFPRGRSVLLKVRLPSSAGEPARDLFCILAEGQRAGPVEVLVIDEKAGSVKVNNSGAVMVLSFERDGPVLRNTPLPPEPPPVLAQPVVRFQ
jgi:hypothetical protein